jgi:hypothetical protein
LKFDDVQPYLVDGESEMLSPLKDGLPTAMYQQTFETVLKLMATCQATRKQSFYLSLIEKLISRVDLSESAAQLTGVLSKYLDSFCAPVSRSAFTILQQNTTLRCHIECSNAQSLFHSLRTLIQHHLIMGQIYRVRLSDMSVASDLIEQCRDYLIHVNKNWDGNHTFGLMLAVQELASDQVFPTDMFDLVYEYTLNAFETFQLSRVNAVIDDDDELEDCPLDGSSRLWTAVISGCSFLQLILKKSGFNSSEVHRYQELVTDFLIKVRHWGMVNKLRDSITRHLEHQQFSKFKGAWFDQALNMVASPGVSIERIDGRNNGLAYQVLVFVMAAHVDEKEDKLHRVIHTMCQHIHAGGPETLQNAMSVLFCIYTDTNVLKFAVKSSSEVIKTCLVALASDLISVRYAALKVFCAVMRHLQDSCRVFCLGSRIGRLLHETLVRSKHVMVLNAVMIALFNFPRLHMTTSDQAIWAAVLFQLLSSRDWSLRLYAARLLKKMQLDEAIKDRIAQLKNSELTCNHTHGLNLYETMER